MSITIKPLSQIAMSSVHDFLMSYQHESAVIDWKYYDRGFNRARERGFACVDNGRIVSFLGLIPFTVMHNGQAVDAAWSCDWYRDPKASGPLGIMLIRHSLEAYPLIYSFGGSEMTKAIMGRLSRITIPTAGIEMYKPLRAGGALYALRRAAHINKFPSLPAIDNIRLPMSNWKSDGETNVRLLNSLPANFDGLLKSRPTDGHLPGYDLSYLQWLLERCPAIAGGVCLVLRRDELIGAVPFWRPVGGRQFWRICLIPCGRDYRMLETGLRKTLRHIRDNGGWLVSLLASRVDRNVLDMARRHGFFRSNSRRPLYVLTRKPDGTPQELEQLSYLDSDYAYRFPGVGEALSD